MTPDLVEEVNNDVVFLYTETVEMLPHSVRKLVFGLSAKFFASRNRWGVNADAPSSGEDPLMDVAGEGGRGVEAVGSAVSVEDVAVESGPLKLFRT